MPWAPGPVRHCDVCGERIRTKRDRRIHDTNKDHVATVRGKSMKNSSEVDNPWRPKRDDSAPRHDFWHKGKEVR